uniref:Uncharacterized protein n=1 Tax=Sphaerodactylus townsendi TaxID=933632 RepID=A0ACB8FNM3_9SAUR
MAGSYQSPSRPSSQLGEGAKFSGMTPLINQACDTLLSHLKAYADSGAAFDIQRNYSSFTLDVVASLAFGIDVDSQKNSSDSFVQNSRRFFERSMFKPLLILTIMFPFIMIPLIRIFPNKKQNEVNGFFISAIKSMIASRDQQDANEPFCSVRLAQREADRFTIAYDEENIRQMENKREVCKAEQL